MLAVPADVVVPDVVPDVAVPEDVPAVVPLVPAVPDVPAAPDGAAPASFRMRSIAAMCTSALPDVDVLPAAPVVIGEPVGCCELLVCEPGCAEPLDVGELLAAVEPVDPVELELIEPLDPDSAPPPAAVWNACRCVRNSSSFARIAGSRLTLVDPLVPTAPSVVEPVVPEVPVVPDVDEVAEDDAEALSRAVSVVLISVYALRQSLSVVIS